MYRYYPQPKKGAEKVEGRVAFYVGKVDGLKLGEPSIWKICMEVDVYIGEYLSCNADND